jgi:hypothetical protein
LAKNIRVGALMSSRHRRYARVGFVVLALLTLTLWQVPAFLSAERYRRRLDAGLEHLLQRPVTFRSGSLRLLPRPGFSLEDVVVREHPAFGSEPFARIDRMECDLRWRSLWRSRLEFVRLRLERPSLNLVRNPQGEWNVENLLLKTGLVSAASSSRQGGVSTGTLDLDVDEGRLDFKVGADKKSLAIVDLRARVSFEPVRGLIRYRLSGNPVRTDLLLPPPGSLELAGEWRPTGDLGGVLNATLQTRGALLYNWIPLVAGRNPGVYGVFDTYIRLSGSLRVVKVEGQAQLTQLHRWELVPPSDPMPMVVHFRGEFDRPGRRALLESLDASFADSRIHLSGAVEGIPAAPELDLVVALERARVEDLVAVGRRLWGFRSGFGISGRVDGLISIQGPWAEQRYAGFVGVREAILQTPSGTFPLSEVAVRIDPKGARLAPVRLALAPRVELVAEGELQRRPPADAARRRNSLPHYELRLSAKSIPVRDLIRFTRAIGVLAIQGFDAQGVGSATFTLSGSAWPLARPTLAGRAELSAARLLIPGLTEPLNIPRARMQVKGDRITIDPIIAVIGTSVFTGRLEHQGARADPWRFEVKANALSIEQSALWFDVLGHRQPLPLLERIPGFSSASTRRAAAANLFSAVNAKGWFEAPVLTYRSLKLEDFRSAVEVSGRVVRVAGVSFRLAGGRGRGRAEVNLTGAPAHVTGEVTVSEARLQTLAPHLPAALHKVHGTASGTAQFETRGLTREEMSANLDARGTLQFKNLSFGDFDPLEALARQTSWGTLGPARGEVIIPSTSVFFAARDRHLWLSKQRVDVDGAHLTLTGAYAFEGALELEVRADFRHVARRRMITGAEGRSGSRVADLRLTGPLDKPTVTPAPQISQIGR